LNPSDFEFVSDFELRASDLPASNGPGREEPGPIGFVWRNWWHRHGPDPARDWLFATSYWL